MRTIIIGDIHSCHEELMDLLDKCQVTSSDRIISLGDQIDRGLYPREVVEFFMQHEAVLGNHDSRQVSYYDEFLKKDRDISKVRFTTPVHKYTFERLDKTHFDYFRNLPTYLELDPSTTDGVNVSLVHAGCLPDVPLNEQDPSILMHISDIKLPEVGTYDELCRLQHGYWRPKTKSWWTSRAPKDARFWASIYDGSLGFVVFGHSGFDEPAHFPHALGIDTGACFGRTLTALVLPKWELVQVPARQNYASSTKCKKYEVHPEIWVYS